MFFNRRVLSRAGRFAAWPLAFALLVALVAGAWAFRNHQRYKHLEVHEPGMVFRSAWLDPDVLAEVIERYQIRSVVNLCRPGEMGEQRWIDERNAVANSGAKLLELPMPLKIDAEFDRQAIASHIEAIGDPENFPMLVHCQHGVTRTAKMLVIYDTLFRNLPAETSLDSMPLFGRDAQNVHVRAFARQLDAARESFAPLALPERLSILRR
jgi:hypothetical protein